MRDRALLETVFLAVHIRADHFKRQGPFNKHHFAIGAMGDALSVNIQRFNAEKLDGKTRSGGGGGRLGGSVGVGVGVGVGANVSFYDRMQIWQQFLGHPPIVSGALQQGLA